ncbi:hypothetical protein ACROYT_G028965 [Oculina patagonica]
MCKNMGSRKYELSREGSDLRLTMANSDITLTRLATAFEVSPGSLYLKEEWGDVTYWANDNGRFNLSCLSDMSSLLVMGQSQSEGGDCLSHTAPPATKKSKLAFNRPFSARKEKLPQLQPLAARLSLPKRLAKVLMSLTKRMLMSMKTQQMWSTSRKKLERSGVKLYWYLEMAFQSQTRKVPEVRRLTLK